MEPPPGSLHLGSNPIKNLLEFYGRQQSKTPQTLYRLLLEDSLSLKNSLQAVAILESSLLGRFYGREHEEPQYFSFRKHGSLARISTVLGCKFVILQLCSARRPPLKIFDSSINPALLGGGAASEEVGQVFCAIFRS